MTAEKRGPSARNLDATYSIYLVTDSTAPLLGSRDLVDVVEQALQGGVTIVQYRDKTSDTGTLIRTARRLHKVCQSHNVPLLINDRVDVALAVGCEGVHVGQDDMAVEDARRLLGNDAIIGCTVSSPQEARIAVKQGADYLGIGTLKSTATKKDTKHIIGINGVRKVLNYLEGGDEFRYVKTVVIGGINADNLQAIKHQLLTPRPKYMYDSLDTMPKRRGINGVAVVSAIIAANDPKAAAEHLKDLWNTPPAFANPIVDPPIWFDEIEDERKVVHRHVTQYLTAVHRLNPLSHNMTNTVVANMAANIALAIGASPIMSNNGTEASDLAALKGGLVINMGTATSETITNQCQAIQAYNTHGAPIILDPVGAGATKTRTQSLQALMGAGYFDVIKGNESEILAVARASGLVLKCDPNAQGNQQRGVDSGTSRYTDDEKAYIVSRIAARERNIVVMTGAIDILSDGERTYAVNGGHKYLGEITGSGCTLGTVMSAYLAAARQEGQAEKTPEDRLHAVMAAIYHFDIAAVIAAYDKEVFGCGTFLPRFIDRLSSVREDIVSDEGKYIGDVEEGEEGRKYPRLGSVIVNMMNNIKDFGFLVEE